MKKDFIPSRDGNLYTWEVNFKSKLSTLGASVGLSPAEITDTVGLINDHAVTYDAKVAAAAAAKAAAAADWS